MSLIHSQALITATVKGPGLVDAPDKIREALMPYPDARIITITQKTNWFGSFTNDTTLLVAIEYTPTDAESVNQ